MSSTDILSQLEETVTPLVADHGLHLEDIVVSGPPNRRVVRVTVDLPDGPGGVGSDVLEALTRAVSQSFDELDPFTGAYQLEVTTPGVDRPLTTARHFRRNIGRLVKLTLTPAPAPERETSPAETLTGRITGVGDADVTVVTENGTRNLALADISQAVVEVEFRPRAKGATHGN